MRAIFFLFILLCSEIHAGDIPINEVRKLYLASATNEDACKRLKAILEEYNEGNNPTMAAYKACAAMMMANYVFNPIGKLSNFNHGKKLLEKCINADNGNIEIRYLRFTVQSESPSFLGYNNAISDDKTFLLNAIAGIKDLQLKQMIVSFLESSVYLTSKEKQNIKP